MTKCEEDLGEAIDDDDEWIQVCLNAQSCSYNLRHKWLQFKTIHRTYYMPVKLNIMHSEVVFCWRCKAQKGTYLHMLWSCEGWLNSDKEYVLLSKYVYRFSLLPVFVCVEMLILETVIRRNCVTKHLYRLRNALPLNGRLVILPQWMEEMSSYALLD